MDERSLKLVFNGIENDHTFASFEDFCEWAEGKAKKGFTVYKIDLTKPHSPKNSYWYYNSKRQEDVVSPICENCDQELRVCDGIGCLKYREWFVKNWNENICIRPAGSPEPQNREVFRYEHPDLEREGIVFAANQSL